jgi:lipoyl synthase
VSDPQGCNLVAPPTVKPSTPKRASLNKLPIIEEASGRGRFPSWLHYPLPSGDNLYATDEILRKYRLNTVCEEAKCPNRSHCYSQQTATFLALGRECTRACGFCDIAFSKQPKAPEADEPERIALSAKELGLKHAVITMVSRDDLPDGGASHIAEIIRATRKENQGITIEVLTSDFGGNETALGTVLNERPDVYNYNIETVRRLTPRVRHKATYERTLAVLKLVKGSQKARFVKSGLMVGLGETSDEVYETLSDLQKVGCDIVTMGQYLQASNHKLPVKEFVTPAQFDLYKEEGLKLGIPYMFTGPFVRSSFHANEAMDILS